MTQAATFLNLEKRLPGIGVGQVPPAWAMGRLLGQGSAAEPMIAASLPPVMVMLIICKVKPSNDVAVRATCATWPVFMALAPSLRCPGRGFTGRRFR